MQPLGAGQEGFLGSGSGGAGVIPVATLAAGSRPPSKTAWPYSEAFTSAASKKLVQ